MVWPPSLGEPRPARATLEGGARARPADRRLDCGTLSLADRLMLWSAVERAQERAEADAGDGPGEELGEGDESEG